VRASIIPVWHSFESNARRALNEDVV
jgi:hypothetical protein